VYKYSTDSTIGIWGGNQNIPKDFTLFQNYPNPFNPETKIKYQLTVKSPVSIIIYDINGREIFFYNKDSKPAGDYEFDWRGIDMQGQDVSSGVYFYKIETEKFSEAKKMVLVR
jgi:flagellar hook assembly protein FlgD